MHALTLTKTITKLILLFN